MSAAVYTVPADPALPELQELFPVSGAPGFVARMVQEVTGRPVTRETAELCHVRYRPTRSLYNAYICGRVFGGTTLCCTY